MENLIGDYLDIIYHITQDRINSKLPKFIANIKSNYYYKRLYKSIVKIKRINSYRLTKNNLLEFFYFVFSNYDGKFGCIEKVIKNEKDDSLNVVLKIENNINSNLKIDGNKEKFEINITYYTNLNKKFFAVDLKALYHENIDLDNALKILNKSLLNDISDYLLEYLSNFMRKEKGYEIFK